MRQAENNVHIEGILSQIELENGSYIKDGRNVETIRGRIYVRVDQTINGKPVTSEIPIELFSPKLTKGGSPNPSYESIMKVKNDMKSIASAGSIEGADCVRINGARIQMNEYFDQTQRFVSFPRISASFISKINKEVMKPDASFTVEMVIGSQGYVENADGTPVLDMDGNQQYEIIGIIPGFQDKVDKVRFVCANENVINSVRDYWEDGATVKASGRLNFTSITETVTTEQGFGENIERSRTKSVRDIVITGGLPTPLEGELAYTAEEIQDAMAARQARLEQLKAKSATSTPKTRPAPAPTNGTKRPIDLGF